MALLSGCVAESGSVSTFQASDKPLMTASISPTAAKPKPGTDEAAVIKVVASAETGTSGTGIPWTNSQTGTAGVITAIHESHNGSTTCRTFETSRQSYEGIALYSGKTCRPPDGVWESLYFRPKHSSDGIDPIATASTG